MLLEFNDVFVVNQNPDAPGNFGEFSIYPDSTSSTGLRVRGGVALSSPDLGQNFNTDSLVLGQKLDFIRGILAFNFGNWKIQPRNRNDVHGFTTGGSGSSVKAHLSNASVSKLYPNPNNGSFTIELQVVRDENIEVSIFDLNGRRIFSQFVAAMAGTELIEIDQKQWPAGMYIMRLSGTNSLQNSRFIVR